MAKEKLWWFPTQEEAQAFADKENADTFKATRMRHSVEPDPTGGFRVMVEKLPQTGS